MDSTIISKIQSKTVKNRPDVKVGDTVKLSLKIKEGEKERTQVFEGLVIKLSGTGINSTLTVRKISSGVGVEKIVPMQSPLLEKIEIIKRGKVRKSKLYYMRDRVGKRALKVGNLKDMYLTDEVVVEEKEVSEVEPVEETARE